MHQKIICFGDSSIQLTLVVPEDGPVVLADLSPAGLQAKDIDEVSLGRQQPLVEVHVLGRGRAINNLHLVHTTVGRQLRYVSHRERVEASVTILDVVTRDDDSGLEVTTSFRTAGTGALQTASTVRNVSAQPVVLQAVTSFAAGAFLLAGDHPGQVELLRARSEWCGEGRWESFPVYGRGGLVDIDPLRHGHDARGGLLTTSTSTWSSGEFNPMGALVNVDTGRAWAWQIEHNGAWHWEVDAAGTDANALALLLSGPTDLQHQWATRIEPGETFTSVPVSIAVSDDGFAGVVAALTRQRRAIRRPAGVDAGLPLIFNDYMNALMGDPTTGKLLPLIDAAAAIGAEYFCIDAGWYDDGGVWWDSVGEWQPSTVRFPDGGLSRVLDHIRHRGMKPGLWLEPEVVGVRSPAATSLPEDAFMSRYGERVVEQLRYHLDLRSPAAVAHLDSVIATLVDTYGIRYFKLDYNITPGIGTDRDALSPGEGLLDHNRAHLAWLEGILDRHPEVVFENCCSGGMRTDYAMLSRLHLQSTSDQQDHRRYATIAAAAPASILPEQAGNWVYPQPAMDDESIAFALVNGMLGRLYLSGPLDTMSESQLELIGEGVAVYKGLRAGLPGTLPYWPLGLPGWLDDAVALGLASAGETHLAVWHRGDQATLTLDLPDFLGTPTVVETVYPTSLPDWNPKLDDTGRLLLTPTAGPSARLFRIALSR